MSVEICLREVDEDGTLVWEGKIQYNSHHLWAYPEYREAAFTQAGRLLTGKFAREKGWKK